jgi:membrane associated rhomboid family serine protease
MSQIQPSRGDRDFPPRRPPAEPTEADVLERLLRLIGDLSPRPFYPRLYARDSGIPADALNHYLRVLWDEGLLVKADAGTPETGAGLTLSLAGVRALDDPGRLARLRPGRAPDTDGRGSRAREALGSTQRPVVTLTLIILNVLIFFIGFYVNEDANGNIIAVTAQQKGTRSQAGSVKFDDLVRGQWWRLLSCCFVHFGMLHVAVNMFSLFQLGRQMERILGWWRYLVVYLLSGVGGSWLAMLWGRRETELGGASGAICGVFGALIAWVILNGRHFPRELVRQWWSNLVLNLVILTFISFMPGVSFLGHFGGLLVGAASVLLLHLHQEAAAPWRWAGVAGLVVMPVLFWVTLDPSVRKARQTSETAKQGEDARKAFESDLLPRITEAGKQGERTYLRQFWPLTEKNPRRRDPDQVKEARQALSERRQELKDLIGDLEKAGPYQDETAEKARTRGLAYIRDLDRLLEMAQEYLDKGGKDETELDKQSNVTVDSKNAFRELLKKE